MIPGQTMLHQIFIYKVSPVTVSMVTGKFLQLITCCWGSWKCS